jgi:hypothetical protein
VEPPVNALLLDQDDEEEPFCRGGQGRGSRHRKRRRAATDDVRTGKRLVIRRAALSAGPADLSASASRPPGSRRQPPR